MEQVILYIKLSTLALVLGYILDLIIGDPRNPFHPVILIGKLISFLEKIARKVFAKGKNSERIGGGLTAILTICISTSLVAVLLIWLFFANKYVYLAVDSILCYQFLATKSLKVESMKVYKSLLANDLEKARYDVSMIVGRDTDCLNQEGIIKATVETVAENTADGVIAPLIFMAIGGAIGGVLYKSVNTLDSMIGYKNEKYQYFGTVGARLDDFFNFLPSRITAILMIVATIFTKQNTKLAYKIWKRDRFNHHSPNSAQTESVVAGALEVQLAGDAVYGNVVKKKKFIGDDVRKIEVLDIKRVNSLMYATSFLAIIITLAIKALIIYGI